MTYDADGLRSTKTVGTRKFEYQYVGDKLYYEKRGDNQEFYYFYDSYGNLSMIYYTLVGSNGSVSRAVYHAVTNAQGDVVALHKQNGQLVARYEYDAWGNTLSVTDANGNAITTWYHIANSNPIRYRGYYYDSDLGLYYLQSRYYDSEIGRFINADDRISDVGGVQGYNMYSYCTNNPVIKKDSEGTSEETMRFNESGSTSTIFAVFALLVLWCYSLTTITASPPKTFSIPKIESKADAATEADRKIKDTVKPDSKDRYWKANRGADKIVRIAEPISFEAAVTEVSAGRSVFTVTSAEAYAVAFVAGGEAEPMWHMKKNKVNYYDHYHINSHSNEAHIWYLF